MGGLYESIDEIVLQVNNMKKSREKEFTDLQISLNQLEENQHEIDMKIDNAKKILDFYGHPSENTHALFSAIKQEEKKDEAYHEKKMEYDDLKNSLENIENQYQIEKEKKKIILNKIESLTSISKDISNLKEVYQKIREEDFKKQIILDKREIYQKKRLMVQKKEKAAELIEECNKTVIKKLEEMIESFKLVLSFIDVDTNRAKIEIEKLNQVVQIVYGAAKDLIDSVQDEEEKSPFCEYLNKYVNEIKKIYKSVSIEAKGSNIIELNSINPILNDNLCNIIRGIFNYILIKCDPKKVVLLVSKDSKLSIKYCVVGKNVDFYGEMQKTPKSILADVYEKIFLMHGKVNCKKTFDGFELEIVIPIKYYL